MKLRDALIHQRPSVALQRAAADEIARLDDLVLRLSNELAGIAQRRMTAPTITAQELEHALQTGATPDQIEALVKISELGQEPVRAGLTD